MKQTLTLLLTILMLAVTGCGYTPDPQDDIALFQPFIDANINKKSDDPYISSIVKPRDDLYPFLVSLQHGKYDGETLDRLVEENNAEAIYWYASLDLIEIKNRQKNFELLDKAAQMGVPYAAWKLSNQSYDCTLYLSSASLASDLTKSLGKDTSFEKKACSEDYLHLSIRLAKEKAKQGDLRSQYFLLKQLTLEGELVPDMEDRQLYNSNYYHLNHSQETREYFIKEVIRFAENHYYQPLMDYVDTQWQYDRNKRQLTFTSEQVRRLVMDLLRIAANNNYLPATEKLIQFTQDEITPNSELFRKNLKLGGKETITSQYTLFEANLSINDRYYWAELYKRLTGSYFIFKEKAPNNEQEKLTLDRKIEDTIKSMTPMVYIDGFTSRDDWVD